MSAQTADAWRCSVCGYIHRASSPPDNCPVCGASREDFEPYVEEPAPARAADVERWRCVNCGYVHTGEQPPESCPVCGVPADRFEPVGRAAESAAGAADLDRVVIIGAGIAGISAAEAIRQACPNTKIMLISKENHLPYYRLNLTRYVAGEVDETSLSLQPDGWYDKNRIQLMRGAEVAGIDPDGHLVTLRDGETLPYNKLILTAGAHPFVPPFPGTTKEGVVRFRTLDDARRIIEAASSGARCVCIGGGILGLEACGGLARRGADVTMLEGHGWLLPRQLNESASPILERHVLGLGIELLKEAHVAEILGDEHVRGVALKDGRTIDADFVVIATGIRPNSYLARLAGLDVNKGVVVDSHLCTSHPDVLAAGDLAEHRGVLYGLWGPSQYQGSIAGMNAAGLSSEFGGIPRSTILKVLGLALFSIGEFEPRDASYEAYDRRTDDSYFRFVFRDNLLVGAILLGDTSQTAAVKSAVESGADFSKLLRTRPGADDVIAHLAERA